MTMERIIIHHTAGTYKPNEIDRLHYHYLIDDTGKVTKGVHSVSDNENCNDGIYAAHTYKGNTGSIGVAICGNYGFNLKTKQSPYPITKVQFNAMLDLCASLANVYKIEPKNIFTHYWFDKCKGIKQGKIDITFIPWKPQLEPDEVCYYIRTEIKKRMVD